MQRLVLIGVFFLFFIYGYGTVRADEFDDIGKKISEITQLLDQSRKATAPLEENLNKIEEAFRSVEGQIVIIESQIQTKENEIAQGEKNLIKQKEIIDRNARVYYKDSREYVNNALGLFLRKSISSATRSFLYQQQSMYRNRDTILKTAFFIKALEEKKTLMEQEKVQLAEAQQSLAKQKEFYNTEVAKARTYQSGLQVQISQLVARQQQLVAQKLASLNIPRSAGTVVRGCSSDLTNGRDPGFSPRFGFFTYGAPHRNGLNQYGGWGRAKAGQNEEQILQEYYPGLSLKKDYDQNTQVNVEGHGTFSIEDYVKRIYEVPDAWADNNRALLKAQAVAARTYALNTMQRRNSICTTEACQVFKPEPKGGNWEQAVNETAGWVLMDGASPAFTQYASTHGGYILNLGKFDGSGGNPNSFAELNERAYDKDSPWFYCNWGSRSEYAGTAWLKSEEIADIANVVLLTAKDGSLINHLWQTDKPNPYNTETWDREKVKSELRARGGNPYSSISEISVSADFASGKTTSVNINGDAGGNSLDAAQFKTAFNSRAPANIQIVGPLFNVEKR
ncbi:MAG: SpoIID/LytB domain-containing protein [Patescibacteria group bacterium]